MDIFGFLYSNLFQTIIIFITGLAALLIYYINKFNEKKDAARIIINEIRIAEKAIQEIKNKKLVFEIPVILPNDTWQHMKHLFINKFDEDELNLINDFYYKCSYAERYRKMAFDIRNKAIFAKSNFLQKKLLDMMSENVDNDYKSYEDKKLKFIKMADAEDWVFLPNTPMKNIIETIENIIYITPTNVGTKLKKIAK